MLGVGVGASAEAVKRAYRQVAASCGHDAFAALPTSLNYRRLALRLHPGAHSLSHTHALFLTLGAVWFEADTSRDPDAPSAFRRLREAYEELRSGGGERAKPFWKERWYTQLSRLRVHVLEKLQGRTRRAEVEPLQTEDERRRRVQEQLAGLQQRASKRVRRRPPGQNQVWVEPTDFKDEAVQ